MSLQVSARPARESGERDGFPGVSSVCRRGLRLAAARGAFPWTDVAARAASVRSVKCEQLGA